MSYFAFRLNQLRVQDGISQQALAEALGVGKSTISMWENEQREPDFETLERIADYFNVSIASFFLSGLRAPTVSGERRNLIKLVDRSGSEIIKELTDEQLSAYKTMVDHLPEADDL